MGFSTGELASASLIGQIGGGLSSAVGGYYSANSQKSSLQFQSDIAGINASAVQTVGDFNARIDEMGAQSALAAGQQQVAAQTLKAGQVMGAQRASLAANGVDLGQGSAAEVQASTSIMKDIDSNTIQANAIRNAWGYRTQGMNAKLGADIQSMNLNTTSAVDSAAANGINPLVSGGTTLLTGAGKVASSWYQYNKNGDLKDTIFGD